MLGRLFSSNKDLALVVGIVAIIFILFTPIPSAVLDIAILLNFGLALTILFLTFYVKRPVEFSTFPSILLIATLFRLSLNIAATRLILTDADAGQVIGAIGEFAIRGEFIVGIVVFFILVVVQYVVVTSGAQRVSEVAARFTLDSMPGQQMSIDADLNMGLIDQNEARERREALEKEAAFYGSMDGASKFVKGDAIAGVIIVLIDIIAGLIIGVMQLGMDWGEAARHYTLLTVGDGIATQLPALIISIATGIIVTRSSADKELSTEVFKQFTLVTRIPLIVAIIFAALFFMPGMPKIPLAILAIACAGVWFLLRRQAARKAQDALIEDNVETTEAAEQTPPAALSIALGPALSEEWKDVRADMMERISALRSTHRESTGFGFPGVQILDGNRIGTHAYEIQLAGTVYASGHVRPDMILALETAEMTGKVAGIDTRDPSFGLPGVWIDADRQEQAREAGYSLIDPMTVLMTHFGEVLKSEASALLTRAVVNDLIEGVRSRQSGLVEELVPTMLTVSDIQNILRRLVSERVSIANLDLILESLCDLARTQKDVDQLTELVRQRLSYQICNALKGSNAALSVLSLDPRLENQMVAGLARNPEAAQLPIDPAVAQSILRQLDTRVSEMLKAGLTPVLLCSTDVRRAFRNLIERSQPGLAVISVAEIPKTIDLESFGIIEAAKSAALSQPPSERPAATSGGGAPVPS